MRNLEQERELMLDLNNRNTNYHIESNSKKKEEAKETKKDGKDEMKIKVKRLDFPALGESTPVTTADFSGVLNTIFRSPAVDYFGSKIKPNEKGQLQMSVWFKPNNMSCEEGQFHTFVPAIRNGFSTEERIAYYNSMVSRTEVSNFVMTEEAQEAFVPFVHKDYISKDKKHIDYRKISKEVPLSSYGQRTQSCVGLWLDPIKVVTAIFGKYDPETNNRYAYQIQVLNPISPTVNMGGATMSNNWTMMISRINTNTMKEVVRKYGYNADTNNLGIITD